jgi:hypothetical protein
MKRKLPEGMEDLSPPVCMHIRSVVRTPARSYTPQLSRTNRYSVVCTCAQARTPANPRLHSFVAVWMQARRCLSCPRRRALWGHSAAAAVANASAAAVAAANGTAPTRLHRILLGCPIPAHPSLSPLVPANSCWFPFGRLVVWSFVLVPAIWSHPFGLPSPFIRARLGRSPTWSSLFRLRVASDRAHSPVRRSFAPTPATRSHLFGPRLVFARARSYPLVCLTFVWVPSCSFGLGWGSLRARLLFKSISKTKLIHT